MHDVFISYSSKDKPTGDAVCAVLEAKGIRCWIAPRDILPGDEWGGAIIKAISEARIFVLLFSMNANDSAQIKREVERATNRGLPIIPLRIEDVMPTGTMEYFLTTPHWLDAFTPPLERHLDYLSSVIAHILEGAPRPTPPPAVETPSRLPATNVSTGPEQAGSHLSSARAGEPSKLSKRPDTVAVATEGSPAPFKLRESRGLLLSVGAGAVLAVTLAAFAIYYPHIDDAPAVAPLALADVIALGKEGYIFEVYETAGLDPFYVATNERCYLENGDLLKFKDVKHLPSMEAMEFDTKVEPQMVVLTNKGTCKVGSVVTVTAPYIPSSLRRIDQKSAHKQIEDAKDGG